MGFCTRCGEKLPDNALFCPRCGLQTAKGETAQTPVSTEDWREAFTQMGATIQKAFDTAQKETEKAFKTARENMREFVARRTLACTNCGAKNLDDSVYCGKCGKKLKQA
jgi:uncharacterized membrane protein YvbJ